MRTMDTVTLSDSEFAALSYLVKHGPVFSSDIDYPHEMGLHLSQGS